MIFGGPHCTAPQPLPVTKHIDMDASLSTISGFDFPARLRALLVHAGLSALLAALAGLLVFALWYPTPFRDIAGGRELFFLVIGVDVIVGPLLTFCIFNRRKPRAELIRDLGVVALLQLGALGYGMHTVYQARPVVLALEGSRLKVVRAIDVADTVSRAPEPLRTLPLWRYQLVGTRAPAGEDTVKSVELAFAGLDFGVRPETWVPWKDMRDEVLTNAKPLSKLLERYPARAEEIKAQAARTGRPMEAIKFLPILGRESTWSALIDASTAELIGFVPVDGF